jgi:hypothetical protein
MPVKINSDGTWAQEYEGPFEGLNVQQPETLISEKATPFVNNFILRNAELRSRPLFKQHSSITTPFHFAFLGVASFIDINGTYHTVAWEAGGAGGNLLYQLNPAGPSWNSLGAASSQFIGPNPISYRVFNNTIYYTSIGVFLGTPGPCMCYWDGITASPTTTQTYADASTSNSVAGISKTDSPTVGGSLPGAPVVVGPLSIGGQFIGELNNRIILANVSVQDQNNGGAATTYNFPNMMWWSANGLPKQWDPTANTSAGFNPFLDVPDVITGLVTLGVAGYLFRSNGITQFAPTGNAIAPWEFDHMWASEHGIGNVYPWSIAQYGPKAIFISEDNVYMLSVTSAEIIGGGTRDAIFADLAASQSNPYQSVNPICNIIPQLQNGYVYLTYQLIIPFSDHSVIYVYSFDEKNWTRWQTSTAVNGSLVTPPNFV